LKTFEKWMLLATAGATALTGFVYGWMRYILEPMDEFSIVHHPLEPWVLKAHILVAPALVFATGMIAVNHVWRHFRSGTRQGRRSGITTGAVGIPMALSGYLIQAVTSPTWLLAWVIVHVVTGAVFAIGVALHYREFLRGRPSRRNLAGPGRVT
jgi:hypothetical protein